MSLRHSALHASHAGIWIADVGDGGGDGGGDGAGGARALGRGEAIARAAETPLILLNAPLVAQRLGYPELSGLDLLELFAFVHPARFAVPTASGLARLVGVAPVETEAEIAGQLRQIAERLLLTMGAQEWREREGAWSSAQTLARMRWSWGGVASAAIARPEAMERGLYARLPEWEERPARPPPRPIVITPDDALARLDTLTGTKAERREGQRAYAVGAADAFAPRTRRDAPTWVRG